MRMPKITLILAPFLIALIHGCQPSLNSPESFADVDALVEDAQLRITEVAPGAIDSLQNLDEYFVLLDVRSESEHNQGYIPGSVLVPRGLLEFRIGSESFWDEEGLYLPEKEDRLVVYCKSGKRSALAADALQKLGYTNVMSISGGFLSWKSAYPDRIEKWRA